MFLPIIQIFEQIPNFAFFYAFHRFFICCSLSDAVTQGTVLTGSFVAVAADSSAVSGFSVVTCCDPASMSWS